MKTTLTRTLMVILFATSISAFAKNDDGKRDDAATRTKVRSAGFCSSDLIALFGMGLE